MTKITRFISGVLMVFPLSSVDAAGNEKEPDPTGAIACDTFGLVSVEEAVVPLLVSRKKGARVRLSFRPRRNLPPVATGC